MSPSLTQNTASKSTAQQKREDPVDAALSELARLLGRKAARELFEAETIATRASLPTLQQVPK